MDVPTVAALQESNFDNSGCSMIEPPTLSAIKATAAANAPHVIRTPVHEWIGREIEERIGKNTRLVLKLEVFQRTGTFKARGAITSVRALDDAERARGVTAVSAGNHAIAVAYAAKTFSTSAKVVMIATADPVRVEAARAYGAEVVLAQNIAEAFALADRLAHDEGRTFIHPFEGQYVALGTGTLALELHEQAGDLDAVIIPIGGGGLCAGVSSALQQLQPKCKLIGVEPAGADTMHRSFAAERPQSRADLCTIADSLAAPFALPYSFALCRRNLQQLVLVEDEEMREAMRLIYAGLKLAVEPAAAAATAALLGPLREQLEGHRVGIILCGSNIGSDRFARLASLKEIA